jgi:hypothetical protein
MFVVCAHTAADLLVWDFRELLIAFGWLLERKDVFYVFAFVHLLDGIEEKPGGSVQMIGLKDGMDPTDRLLSPIEVKMATTMEETIHQNCSLLRTSGSQMTFEKKIASLFAAKRKLKKKVQSLGDEVFFDPLMLYIASKRDTKANAVEELRDRFRAEAHALRKAKQFSRWRDCFLEWISKQIPSDISKDLRGIYLSSHDHDGHAHTDTDADADADADADDVASVKECAADETWVDGFRHLLRDLETSRSALQWINESWENTKRVKLSSSCKEKEMKTVSESIARMMDSLEMTEMAPYPVRGTHTVEQITEKLGKDMGMDTDSPYSMDLEMLDHYFQIQDDAKGTSRVRRKTTHDASWRQKSSLMAVDHILQPIADTARSSAHTMGKLHESIESAMESFLIGFSNHRHGKKCQFIARK